MNSSDILVMNTASSTAVPAVAAGDITIYPEGNCDHSEFPDLCKKEGSGVAWRPPAGLLGSRTEMAACHRKGASFCPGDWQLWP